MSKINFWSISLLLVFSAFYFLSEVIAPFLIAFIFAYLLQPVIEANSKRFGVSRGYVATSVFLLFFALFTLAILLLIPVIYDQFVLFINNIPKYKSNLDEIVFSFSKKFNSMGEDAEGKIFSSIQNFVDTIFTMLSMLANHIWEYMIATINFFVIIVLVPFILFYFIRDWDIMSAQLESFVPKSGKNKVHEIFSSINELLSGYIRGQLNICVLLALYYSFGLYIIGADLALLLGILSGFLVIIPFIGAVISFLLMEISCYVDFGFGKELLYVLILFILGHMLEGYILTPKIIGKKIGLHPVWVIFAVFAAGNLFGIIGIIFAIPVAGIIKVLLLHLVGYYKSSSLYKG